MRENAVTETARQVSRWAVGGQKKERPTRQGRTLLTGHGHPCGWSASSAPDSASHGHCSANVRLCQGQFCLAPKKAQRQGQGRPERALGLTLDRGRYNGRTHGRKRAAQPPGEPPGAAGWGPAGPLTQPRAFLFPGGKRNGKEIGRTPRQRTAKRDAEAHALMISSRARLDTNSSFIPGRYGPE